MLVNMIGVDDGDEITNIDAYRVEPLADPKTRVTLTTLFGALLSSYAAIDVGATPPSAPIAGTIDAGPAAAGPNSEHDARRHAA